MKALGILKSWKALLVVALLLAQEQLGQAHGVVALGLLALGGPGALRGRRGGRALLVDRGRVAAAHHRLTVIRSSRPL